MTYTVPNFKNSPTAFMRANALLDKSPIYYLSFGKVTGPFGENSQVLPDEYCTSRVKGSNKSRLALLSIPSGYSTEFNPITYESTLSEINFSLNNTHPEARGEITRILTSYVMKNRWVTVYRGFDFLDEADYIIIYQGIVSNVVLDGDATGYTFTVVEAKKAVTATILQGHTQLSQVFTWNQKTNVGATTMYIKMCDGFAPKTDMADGMGARNYIRVGSNVFSYTAFADSSEVTVGTSKWVYVSDGPREYLPGGYIQWVPFWPYSIGDKVFNLGRRYQCTQGGTSFPSWGGPIGTGDGTGLMRFTGVALVTPDGDGNPVGQTYNIGENADNMVMFSGHPIDLILWILLSTGDGSNYSGVGTNYDVLPRGQGIGIPYTQVDIVHFQQVKAEMGAMTFHDFFIDEIEALKFIQEQILQQAHIMLFVNRSGKIDCASITSTLTTTGAIQLDETNVIGIPEFNLNLPTGGYFYNKIVVNYDHHIITDTYNETLWDYVKNTVTTYMEESVLPINAPMIDSAYGGDVLAERCSSIFMSRFTNPPPLITLSTFDALSLLDPGNIVVLNHPNVPVFQLGKDGGPITCQVMSVNPEWETGTVKVVLLAVGWYN
jgi:hypothetical protein